jgi:hypothetical protein
MQNPGNCTSFDCIGFVAQGTLYGSYDSPAVAPPVGKVWEFASGAVMDVDDNGKLDVQLYESGNGTSAGIVPDALAALAPCGPGIPTSEVFNCTPYAF